MKINVSNMSPRIWNSIVQGVTTQTNKCSKTPKSTLVDPKIQLGCRKNNRCHFVLHLLVFWTSKTPKSKGSPRLPPPSRKETWLSDFERSEANLGTGCKKVDTSRLRLKQWRETKIRWKIVPHVWTLRLIFSGKCSNNLECFKKCGISQCGTIWELSSRNLKNKRTKLQNVVSNHKTVTKWIHTIDGSEKRLLVIHQYIIPIVWATHSFFQNHGSVENSSIRKLYNL